MRRYVDVYMLPLVSPPLTKCHARRIECNQMPPPYMMTIGQEFAVKIISRKELMSLDDVMREVAILKKVNQHP